MTISLNVENLTNGTQRVTSRINGRSVKYVDAANLTKEQCFDVLRAAASSHEISRNVFSMEYIKINDAAKQIMEL